MSVLVIELAYEVAHPGVLGDDLGERGGRGRGVARLGRGDVVGLDVARKVGVEVGLDGGDEAVRRDRVRRRPLGRGQRAGSQRALDGERLVLERDGARVAPVVRAVVGGQGEVEDLESGDRVLV